MRMFDFINGGKRVSAICLGDFYYTDLNSCKTENAAFAIVRYVCNFSFLYPHNENHFTILGDKQFVLQIPTEEWDKVNFEIIGYPELAMKPVTVMRPAYLIRGERVSAEDAAYIIANSDMSFTQFLDDVEKSESDTKDIVALMYLDKIISTPYHHILNRYLPKLACTQPTGFVHPDGTVGVNRWTASYPKHYELYIDAWTIAARFPILEFVIAVTNWDMRPAEFYSRSSDDEFVNLEEYLERDLQYCLYVHDGVVEIIKDLTKYNEFSTQYMDQRVFEIKGYHDVVLQQPIISKEYLETLIGLHEMNGDSKLAKYLRSCWDLHYNK